MLFLQYLRSHLFIAMLIVPFCQGIEIEKSYHTNNWAIIVDTSRFWFNYRHSANVLSIYTSVKRLGIPDSQIILMLADDMACNPRNPRPATVYNNINKQINVYGDDVEVDYRGYEVTVENFLRLLLGREIKDTPRSKRLHTDEGSNILVYMTGHGGKGYIKFQDSEELNHKELAEAVEQMWQKRRYNEILFIFDTCQAASLYEKFYSPNILATSSSLSGQDSSSHHSDPAIGVHIIDSYTYNILEFLKSMHPNSKLTMSEFFKIRPKSLENGGYESTVGVRTDLFKRDPRKVLITDFFGSVRPIVITTDPIFIWETPARKNKKAINKTKVHKTKSSYLPQFPPMSVIKAK